MPTHERVRDLVAMVEAGKFVEAIEEFYTDDASMQENGDAPRRGIEALVAGEKAVLSALSISTRLGSVFLVDGDRSVIHWMFTMTYADGSHFDFEELAYQLWRGDRIVEERFFYDPGQRKPPAGSGARG